MFLLKKPVIKPNEPAKNKGNNAQQTTAKIINQKLLEFILKTYYSNFSYFILIISPQTFLSFENVLNHKKLNSKM